MTGPAREYRAGKHAEKLDKILSGVVKGQSIREISEDTGVPKSTVQRMARAALDRYVPDQYGNRTQMLARELKILDMLTERNLVAAANGDRDCARIVIKAHERRCRLLGLDAPTRTKLEVQSQFDREIGDLLDMLGAQ